MSEYGEHQVDLMEFLVDFCGTKGENVSIAEKQINCVMETIEKYGREGYSPEEVCGIILNQIKQCKDECLAFPSEYGKDLMEYQSRAVQHLLVNPGLLTAFATGTGKTLTAVSSAACIHHVCKFLSKPLNIVVVTPASLVSNMENEFKKFPYFMRNSNAYVVVGSEMFRRYVLAREYEAELISKMHTTSNPMNAKAGYYVKNPERGKLLDQTVFSKSPINFTLDHNTLLIVDEAHEFKTDWDFMFHESVYGKVDPESNTRAKVFMEMVVPKVWKIMLMTATPALNRWYDILNLICAVKNIPRQDMKLCVKEEKKYRIFRTLQPLIPSMTPEQKDIINTLLSLQQLEISNSQIEMTYPMILRNECFKNAIMFRNVDYDSGDFPSRRDTYLKAYMSSTFYREYMAIVAKHKKKDKKSGDQLEDQAQQAFTLQRYIAMIPGNPKNSELVDIIRSGAYKKISIYSRFVGPLKGVREHIYEVASELGYSLDMITGELTKSQKDATLEKYNNAEKAIILLSDAGGQGLDFKGINVSIVYEPGINESREEQFIGRAVRYRSHVHLPPEERNVVVIRMVMVFPPGSQKNERTPDQALIANTLAKAAQSNFLINQLRKIDEKEVIEL
jgi:SNF2 family DNA or RNA helicase